MTNQPRARFIPLLTAHDEAEARRARVMTSAFWLAASAQSQPPRTAQVIDLRRTPASR